MPGGKRWKGLRSTKREKKTLENAVVTDGEIVSIFQMEASWRALLLQAGHLLEKSYEKAMSFFFN